MSAIQITSDTGIIAQANALCNSLGINEETALHLVMKNNVDKTGSQVGV